MDRSTEKTQYTSDSDKSSVCDDISKDDQFPSASSADEVNSSEKDIGESATRNFAGDWETDMQTKGTDVAVLPPYQNIEFSEEERVRGAGIALDNRQNQPVCVNLMHGGVHAGAEFLSGLEGYVPQQNQQATAQQLKPGMFSRVGDGLLPAPHQEFGTTSINLANISAKAVMEKISLACSHCGVEIVSSSDGEMMCVAYPSGCEVVFNIKLYVKVTSWKPTPIFEKTQKVLDFHFVKGRRMHFMNLFRSLLVSAQLRMDSQRARGFRRRGLPKGASVSKAPERMAEPVRRQLHSSKRSDVRQGAEACAMMSTQKSSAWLVAEILADKLIELVGEKGMEWAVIVASLFALARLSEKEEYKPIVEAKVGGLVKSLEVVFNREYLRAEAAKEISVIFANLFSTKSVPREVQPLLEELHECYLDLPAVSDNLKRMRS